ncbi:hypothetical protein HDV02_003232 [Globomyces sp. JEL0801]|nr:hypothetical protein HDV02_003232 [Globomyces sp. JEL0801]
MFYGGSVTSFQLSEFYKRYLEESHEMMVEYNRNLWIENVKSLGPGLKYEAHQLKKIVHKATRNIRERFRLFLAFWFTAGLTAPLLLIK